MNSITAEQYIVSAGAFNPSTGKNDSSSASWSSVGNCLFWEGSQAENVVASKIRDRVDAVAVFYPNVSVTGDRLRINNDREYEIIAFNNIAFDNEVLMVALKEIT